MLHPLSDDATPEPEEGGADPTEVASKSFATTLRGYDQDEVRAYLREVASSLRDAQRREAEIRSRLGKAVRRAEEASNKLGAIPEEELTDRLGAEVTRVIESARIAAEERTARSVAEAEALVNRARSEAEAIRSDAQEVLSERTKEAEERAASILAEADAAKASRKRQGEELYGEAQDLARDHLEQAQREAESIVEQAEVARRQILKDMDRRRRQMRLQVEQLKAARDRLLASHGEMSRTLDEMAVELRQSVVEAKVKGEKAARRMSETPFATPEELESEVADGAMIGRLDLPEIELRDDLDVDAIVGERVAPDAAEEPAGPPASVQVRLPNGESSDADSPEPDAVRGPFADAAPEPSNEPEGVDEEIDEEDEEIEAEVDEIDEEAENGRAEVELVEVVDEEDDVEGGTIEADDGFFIAAVTDEHPVVSLPIVADGDPDEDDADDDEASFDDDDDEGYDEGLLAEVALLFPDGPTPDAEITMPPDGHDNEAFEEAEGGGPEAGDETSAGPSADHKELSEAATPHELGETDAADELAAEADVGNTEPDVGNTEPVASEPDPEAEVETALEAILAELPEFVHEDEQIEFVHPSRLPPIGVDPSLSRVADDTALEADDTVLDADDPALEADNTALDVDDPVLEADVLGSIFGRLRHIPDGAGSTVIVHSEAVKVTTEVATSTTVLTEAGSDIERASDSGGLTAVVSRQRQDVDDAAVIDRRDDALRGLSDVIARRLKRVLMDEQNVVLEAAEREYNGPLIEIMPDTEHHLDLYLDSIFVQLQAAYGAGAAFINPEATVRKLPRSFFERTLVDMVVTPLREMLDQSISGDDNGEVIRELRRFYRSHKNNAVSDAAAHLALLAFSKGSAAAIGDDVPVRWVHAAHDGGCIDGERNAEAGSIPLGEVFPSGQILPPATVGCRCLLVPGDR